MCIRDRQRLAQDLQRKGYMGRTVGIKLRYDDFKTATRDHTLELPMADAATLRRAAGQCLKRVPLAKRLRLLGVRVGNLVRTADWNATAHDPLAREQLLRGPAQPAPDSDPFTPQLF